MNDNLINDIINGMLNHGPYPSILGRKLGNEVVV